MEFEPQVEEIDFNKYWLILKRRWLPSTAVFCTTILLTIAMITSQKPVYEAEGKLLFKKRDFASTILNDNGQGISQGQLESLNQQNSPVDTEIQILNSIPLVQKSIAALDLKDGSGNPLTPQAVINRLTVTNIKGTDIVSVSYQSHEPKQASAFVNKLIQTYIESNILINRTEAKAAREFITYQLPKTEASLRKAESNLRRFDELNNIVSLPDESKSAVEFLSLLNQRLADVRANLANTTEQSRILQSQLGLNPETAMVLNSLSQSVGVQSVLTELQKVETELATQSQLYREKHPIIIQLQKRRDAINALLKSRISEVIGSHQSQANGNLQVGSSEQKLIDSLIANEVSRLGLISQSQALLASQSGYLRRARLLPKLAQQRRALERQVETIQSSYEILAKRLQEVEIIENQNVGNARIVAAATIPQYPTASKKKIILIGGFVAGALLYVVVAFVLDLIDPSIKTGKEARECFNNLFWLGMIPLSRQSDKSVHWLSNLTQFSKLRKINYNQQLELFSKYYRNLLNKQDLDLQIPDLPVRDSPHSLESEAYRMLQSNLKFLKPDHGLHTIVVTSSVSREGKSTVSANLAFALSQMDRKVLLVDADLHHPIQHHIWGLTNVVGLSDVIVNQADFSEAVKLVHENLSVLPSGAIPPNALALIDSNRMNLLVQEFAKTYDVVIFDTPPLVLVSDVLMLGRMTDGILLVARPGVLDMASAMATKERLAQSQLDVLGLVINGVIVNQEPDNYLRHVKAYHEEVTSALKESV